MKKQIVDENELYVLGNSSEQRNQIIPSKSSYILPMPYKAPKEVKSQRKRGLTRNKTLYLLRHTLSEKVELIEIMEYVECFFSA